MTLYVTYIHRSHHGAAPRRVTRSTIANYNPESCLTWLTRSTHWYSQNADAVDNTGTKHYDDAVRLLATSDREIYDGDRDHHT
jgi:hypothetical protein